MYGQTVFTFGENMFVRGGESGEEGAGSNSSGRYGGLSKRLELYKLVLFLQGWQERFWNGVSHKTTRYRTLSESPYLFRELQTFFLFLLRKICPPLARRSAVPASRFQVTGQINTLLVSPHREEPKANVFFAQAQDLILLLLLTTSLRRSTSTLSPRGQK